MDATVLMLILVLVIAIGIYLCYRVKKSKYKKKSEDKSKIMDEEIKSTDKGDFQEQAEMDSKKSEDKSQIENAKPKKTNEMSLPETVEEEMVVSPENIVETVYNMVETFAAQKAAGYKDLVEMTYNIVALIESQKKQSPYKEYLYRYKTLFIGICLPYQIWNKFEESVYHAQMDGLHNYFASHPKADPQDFYEACMETARDIWVADEQQYNRLLYIIFFNLLKKIRALRRFC